MKLKILGEPKAKQSFRFAVGKKGRVHKYKPKGAHSWEAQARAQVVAQLPENFRPYEGPVIIKNLTFVFSIPKSFPKYRYEYIKNGGRIYKTSKPDVMDNLSKALMDSCEGVLFLNDSQIVAHRGLLCKIYGLVPRVEFEIKKVKEVTYETIKKSQEQTFG